MSGYRTFLVTWTAPTGTVTGYDFHYTSALDCRWETRYVCEISSDPATAARGWVEVDRSTAGTRASQTISGLSKERDDYIVRVRSKNADGTSDWLYGLKNTIAGGGVCDRTEAVRDDLVANTGYDASRLHGDWTKAAYWCAWVTAADLAGVTSLNVTSKGITAFRPGDFDGLTGLRVLHAIDNHLTALPDLSGLTALTELHVSRNRLTALPDLSKNTRLTKLSVSANRLPKLPDLSKNTRLTELWVSSNRLTALPDLSKNTALTRINAQSNQLTELPDLTKNTALTNLNVSENRLTELPDLSKNTRLTDLWAFSNRLTTLPDLSNLTALTRLYIGRNPLSNLSALKLTGSDGNVIALNPTFDGATTTYTAVAAHGVTDVSVAPRAADTGVMPSRYASLFPAPTIKVARRDGSLDTSGIPIDITVRGRSGGPKTYTVTVTRDKLATPEVSISAGAGVIEGGSATFTVTASPAPAAALTVDVTVTESGGYATAGTRQVTVPTGGTATFTVATIDDGADEPDGSVTATVTAGSGYTVSSSQGTATVAVTDNDDPAPAPLTASFERVPEAHDGAESFWFNVRFSEALGEGGAAPVAASFAVMGGSVKRVRQVEAGLWRVRIKPDSWRDVRVTLPGGRGCDAKGAVCAAGARALSNETNASVAGPARITLKGGKAREGRDATLDFAVTLSRAAAHAVSVDYATADGTATAGADYRAASGTLTFAPGETAKTVAVAILDDAIDEGKETFLLKLSNPKGAFLRAMHREAKGVIRNDDPLQKMWLSRFGRMVASDAVEAVTGRLETPRGAGSHLTLAGQRLDLAQAEDGEALAGALAGLARSFGGHVETPDDDPFGRHGPGDAWNDPTTTPARSMTGRELLLGTSFRAVLGQGAGSQLTSWGQGASVSAFSAEAPGLTLSGDAATGALGFDYERGPLLTGFALTHSVGDGAADDGQWRYAMGSTATTMLPYARYALSERVSTWAMAGTGSGSLTLDLDGGVSQHYDTDLSMTLAALGVRGELLSPAEPGGFSLALKADAFWVRTESDGITETAFGNLMGARGESSRLRAVLDGSRTFALAGGRALSPSLELGLRHDGGDAETGTGLELGAGLGYADASRGLDMTLKVHGLAMHAEDGYGEWGVSGRLRLVPGGAGRGLSASLTPSYGVDPGGAERLWALPDASGLAANENADPSSRLDAEVGYGMPVFGGGFTGTPSVGLGLSDTAREVRMGWRLSPAGGEGFELNLDATRRAPADGNDAEHGVMLSGRIRW